MVLPRRHTLPIDLRLLECLEIQLVPVALSFEEVGLHPLLRCIIQPLSRSMPLPSIIRNNSRLISDHSLVHHRYQVVVLGPVSRLVLRLI